MAERLFAQEISKSDLPKKIVSYSAGLSAMDGDKASQNSIDACNELGLDITDHKAPDSPDLARRSLRCLLYD